MSDSINVTPGPNGYQFDQSQLDALVKSKKLTLDQEKFIMQHPGEVGQLFNASDSSNFNDRELAAFKDEYDSGDLGTADAPKSLTNDIIKNIQSHVTAFMNASYGSADKSGTPNDASAINSGDSSAASTWGTSSAGSSLLSAASARTTFESAAASSLFSAAAAASASGIGSATISAAMSGLTEAVAASLTSLYGSAEAATMISAISSMEVSMSAGSSGSTASAKTTFESAAASSLFSAAAAASASGINSATISAAMSGLTGAVAASLTSLYGSAEAATMMSAISSMEVSMSAGSAGSSGSAGSAGMASVAAASGSCSGSATSSDPDADLNNFSGGTKVSAGANGKVEGCESFGNISIDASAGQQAFVSTENTSTGNLIKKTLVIEDSKGKIIKKYVVDNSGDTSKIEYTQAYDGTNGIKQATSTQPSQGNWSISTVDNNGDQHEFKYDQNGKITSPSNLKGSSLAYYLQDKYKTVPFLGWIGNGKIPSDSSST